MQHNERKNLNLEDAIAAAKAGEFDTVEKYMELLSDQLPDEKVNGISVEGKKDRNLDALGAIVNQKDANGRTLLHYLAEKNKDDIAIELVMFYGANPLMPDNNGMRPVDIDPQMRVSLGVDLESELADPSHPKFTSHYTKLNNELKAYTPSHKKSPVDHVESVAKQNLQQSVKNYSEAEKRATEFLIKAATIAGNSEMVTKVGEIMNENDAIKRGQQLNQLFSIKLSADYLYDERNSRMHEEFKDSLGQLMKNTEVVMAAENQIPGHIWNAVQSGDKNMVEKYIMVNVDLINVTDGNGRTLLHHVAALATEENDYGDLIKKMIGICSADPFIKDKQGISPIDLAFQNDGKNMKADGTLSQIKNALSEEGLTDKVRELDQIVKALQATPAQETVSKIVNPPPVAEPEKAVSSPEVSTPVPKQASPAATAPAQQQAPQMKNTRMENIVNGLTSASQKNILVEYQALSKRLLDYTKISNMVKDVFSSTDANWQRFHELKPIVEAIAAQKISDGDPVKKRMAADAQYALAKSEGYLVSAADNKQANKYGDLMQAACKNEQPDAMLETAKANTKKGNQDFAAELFAKILKSNPENDERTYLAQKETRKFLRENGSFLKKHPELVTALKSAQEKINDIDKKSTKSLGITSLINKLLHKDDQPKQEEDIQIKSPGKR